MVQVGCTNNYGRRCLWKQTEEIAHVDYPANVGENDAALPSIRNCLLRLFRHPSWACGAAGSALPWHGRGRRFDPDQVHQVSQWFSFHRHFDPEVLTCDAYLRCWYKNPKGRFDPNRVHQVSRRVPTGETPQLTLSGSPRNIPPNGCTVPTRGADGFSLPHPSQDRRRRHGCGLQGGRHRAWEIRRIEIPPRRLGARPTSSRTFSPRGACCIRLEPS